MRIVRWLLGPALLAVLGCGGSPPPPTPQPAPPLAKPARPPVPAKPGETLAAHAEQADEGLYPPFPYLPKGRRDPFRPLPPPASAGELDLVLRAMKLVGVLQGREGRLALVESPEGLGYILKPGDVIGGAQVVKIENDTLIVRIRTASGATKLKMRLSTAR
ncbi:MAG: hypothetical protein ACE5FK_00740 [Candidatus Methylomirabilia bacterium]